jgi:fructosamine-3-kinase
MLARRPLPDRRTLAHGLQTALSNGSRSPIRLLSRTPNLEGSFPHEVVSCSIAGKALHLFCKYGSTHTGSGHGHRGGVPREVEVYRRVLEASSCSSAPFFGFYVEPRTGATWLLLEYISGAFRVNKSPDQTAIYLAAQWLAKFHTEQEQRIDGLPRILPLYDADYFRGWAERTLSFSEERPRWLEALCDAANAFARLIDGPLSVVHGEYYPKNILVRGSDVYPVDWESAALGAGEVDLAMLTENWPADVVRRCIDEYCAARWPSGPPADFESRLGVARLYVHLRWLGNKRDDFVAEFARLERAARLADDLGLV